MLSKGSLTVLPVVTDNVAYNLEMQPASKAASGSSGQTNYLYVSPNLVFNPATNQLVFNTSVVFGGTATYANGSPVGSGTNTGSIGVGYTGSIGSLGYTGSAGIGYAGSSGSNATVNTAAAYAFTNSTASGNATSGAITTTGGIGVANNVYVGGRIGWSNSINISVAYTYYNANTNSLDTVFG